jgi:hypothetical protein
MRTLLLSAVVLLAACDGTQPTTGPASARSTPTALAQENASDVNNQGKPAAGAGFTVTTVTSADIYVPGGATAGQAYCPAGSTAISGGYAFVNEGSWSALPVVTQNQPFGNGWWVRVVNSEVGHMGMTFRVYVVCAS